MSATPRTLPRWASPLQGVRDQVAAGTWGPAVLLAALVVVATAWIAHWTGNVTGWLVQTDELFNAHISMHMADALWPSTEIRGAHTSTSAVLYPMLIAPAFRLFATPRAYDVIHVLNPLIMASTAIPAWLIVRTAGGTRRAAFATAALTAVVPWLAMSAMILTEIAAYPAFAWAVLGILAAIVAPSDRRDVLALLAIALGFFARTQFALLALILPAAIVIHATVWARHDRRPLLPALRATARSHRVLLAAYGLGVLYVVVRMLGGRSFASLFGNYSNTLQGDLLPPGIFDNATGLTGFAVVAVGILPFAVGFGWALESLVRPSVRRFHAFATVLVLTAPLLVLQAASFNVRFASGAYQDRYVFYLAPLMFAGLALCFEDPRRRFAGIAAATALFVYLVPKVYFDESRAPIFAAPDTSFFPVWRGRAPQLGGKVGLDGLTPPHLFQIVAIAGALVSALLLWRWRRYALGVLAGGLLVFMVAETSYIVPRVVDLSHTLRGLSTTRSTVDKDWIDQAVPGDATVTMVPGESIDYFTSNAQLFWDLEYWNKRVLRMLSFQGTQDTFGALPSAALTLDWRTGRMSRPYPESDYWVMYDAEMRFRPRVAQLVATKKNTALAVDVYRITDPRQADWATRGALPRNYIPGGPHKKTTLRFYGGGGGPGGRPRLRHVTLGLWNSPDLSLIGGARRFSVTVDGHPKFHGRLAKNQTRNLKFDVCVPARRNVDVVVRISRQDNAPNIGPAGARMGVTTNNENATCRP